MNKCELCYSCLTYVNCLQLLCLYTFKMKRIFSYLLLFSLISCAQNLVTGRKQLSLVSETELQTMAQQEYKTFLNDNKVVSAGSNRDAEMVRRAGSRIALAIKNYYDSKGMSSVLEGYQ